MNTNHTIPFTAAQARTAAKYLLKFPDLTNVRIVENLSYGTCTVEFSNACGMPRTLTNTADLIDIKETELLRLRMR